MGVHRPSTWTSKSKSRPTLTTSGTTLFSLGFFHRSAVTIIVLVILLITNHHGCKAATTVSTILCEGVFSAAAAAADPTTAPTLDSTIQALEQRGAAASVQNMERISARVQQQYHKSLGGQASSFHLVLSMSASDSNSTESFTTTISTTTTATAAATTVKDGADVPTIKAHVPPQSSTAATLPKDSHDRNVGDSHDDDGDDDDNNSNQNNSDHPSTATTASTATFTTGEDVLLDRYIDFLQQDFENDQRLDQYIEFVQDDYDADLALDHYIDYLLATTTSGSSSSSSITGSSATSSTAATGLASDRVALDSLQQQQPAHGQTKKETAIPTTTRESNNRNETIVWHASTTTTATSDDGRKRRFPTELDNYIDRLVTAVELDEYIEILVASVHATSSTQQQQQQQEERERDLTCQQQQEEKEVTAMDDYIANMLLTTTTSTTEQGETVTDHSTASKSMITTTTKEGVVAAAKSGTAVSDSQQEASEKEEDIDAVEGNVPVSVTTVLSGGDDDDDDDGDDLSDSNKVHLYKKEQEDATPFDLKDPSLGSVSEDEVGELHSVKASASNGKLAPKKRRKKKQKAKDLLVKEVEQAPATENSALDTSNLPAIITEEEEAPKLSPNGLYRFLLTKGRIGHVLVMILIFWVEWIQMYLPQIADLLLFLWLKVAPVGLQRRLAPQEYLPGDARSSPSSSVQQMYSGRMPVKGKQRNELSKRADEEALAQLQRIGDIQDAKYKQVSQAFMRRHGLGSYETVEEIHFESKLSKKKKQSRKKMQSEDEEVDSDVEWVLEGLSSKSGTKSPSAENSFIDPKISFGVGSKGPTMEVGFEIDLGGGGNSKESRRSASALDRDAITRDVVRKKTAGPRSGDRDGGSGVIGRLRAAATSNNLVSSRLLGAYPGDVVPPNEAADAGGVAGLAKKYGYGEWSDEEYDDDGDECGHHDDTRGGYSGKGKSSRRKRTSQPKQKKRTKRRSSEKKRGFSEEGSLDFSNLFDYSEEEGDNSPTQAPKATPTRKKRSTRSSSVKQTGGIPRIRPPLDLLDDERRKASRRRRKKREKADPMVSGTDAPKKSNEESKRDMDKLIRPPLEKLKEAQSTLQDSSHKADDDDK